jgi:hypothetical protein
MKVSTLIPSLAVALALIAAIAIRWNWSSGPEEGASAIGFRSQRSQLVPPPGPIPSREVEALKSVDDFETAHRILAMIRSDNPLDQSRAYRELLPALVRSNPRAAAEFVQSPAAAELRVDLMPVVVQAWTEVDADAAEAWASRLSNPAERNMALGYVSFAAVQADPARAAQVLENSKLNADRREIIVANLAQQLADRDLQPLYKQIEKLPPGDERDNLYRWVALAQSHKDPANAVTLVTDRMAAGPIQSDAAIQILRQWARKDMTAASAWVDQFPPGSLREQAIKVLSGELYGAYIPELDSQ